MSGMTNRGISPKVRARKLDLHSSDAVAVVGRARGHALCVGQLAILLATAPPADRAATAQELRRYALDYVDHVRSILNDATHADALSGAGLARRRLLSMADAVMLMEASDFASIDRAAAATLARRTRDEALPDLYAIIVALQDDEIAQDRARVRLLTERGSLLDRLLVETEAIGRTLNLVRHTATTEAEGLDGEAGRVFAALAAEVGALAGRCKRATGAVHGALRDGMRAATDGPLPSVPRGPDPDAAAEPDVAPASRPVAGAGADARTGSATAKGGTASQVAGTAADDDPSGGSGPDWRAGSLA